MQTKTITLILSVFLACKVSAQTNPALSKQALLSKVSKVASMGTPGPLFLFKETAFPFLASPNGNKLAVAAAATLGNGRVVAFGHEGYVNPNDFGDTDTNILIANAVRWSSGKPNPIVLTRDLAEFSDFLEKQGFKVKRLDYDVNLTPDVFNGIDMIVINPESLSLEEGNNELEQVKNFIKSGKGGLFAQLGWGWLQLNPGKTLEKDFIGNKLLKEAGIAWIDGYLDQPYFEPGEISPYLNYANAKKYVLSNDFKTAKHSEYGQALSVFLDGIPLMKEQNFKIASDFPGDVPNGSPTVLKTISIDSKIPNWKSTGLYAPAGAAITVDIPANAAKAGIRAHIGAHSDQLYNVDGLETDGWKRIPEVVLDFGLEAGKNQIFNPFGGLIYLNVPQGCTPMITNIVISGGVEAPYFKLGKTSVADWLAKIRNNPAPWGEVEGNEFTFTIESKYLRTLNNPDEVALFWDKIQAANRKLSSWKADKPHQMRVVFDRQISGGYMHSGYPIMALTGEEYVDEQANIINLKELNKWGFVHELGHNHQEDSWTFDGTGEVTCNLFSLYAIEKVLGVKVDDIGKVMDGLSPEAKKKLWDDYLATDKSFEKWKSEPFLALVMYIQLQQRYGWASFEKVFASYAQMTEEQLPKDEDGKRDFWLQMYSQTVGENLSGFFDAWNVPVSEEAKKSLSKLPKANVDILMGELR